MQVKVSHNYSYNIVPTPDRSQCFLSSLVMYVGER